MTTASDRLSGVYLKIDRAKKHISDLVSSNEFFSEANRNAFRMDIDENTGEEVFRVAICQPIPPGFPLVVGDAIHNLRSALDHLAWQLVETNGGKPDRNTCFPIIDPRERKAVSRAVVKGMSDAAIQLIEAVQPNHAGYDSLWKLHDLDRIDKHRMLVVVAYRLGGIAFITPGLTQAALHQLFINGAKASICFEVPGPISGGQPILKDGDELGRVGQTLHLKPNIEFTTQIAVNEPGVVEGEPVVPLLTDLAKVVEGVVNQFKVAGVI